ncbi:sigma factor [Oerskovia sp. M15]
MVASADDADELVVLLGAEESRARGVEFAAFMEGAKPSLARTAWLLCGDAHRAEELVQHALVRTYMAWPRARAGDPLAYARRVLANGRIDTWRKHRREYLVSSSDVPLDSAPSSEGASRSVTSSCGRCFNSARNGGASWSFATCSTCPNDKSRKTWE